MSKSYEALRTLIPDVAHALCEAEGVTGMDIRMVVSKYAPSGALISRDYHVCDRDDLMNDVRRARHIGCVIRSDGEKVTVRRYLSSGDYFIAEYSPIGGTK